jgi:hypothetical protein
VQAIIVAIDQYAEAALGNWSYFLNTPYGVGVTGATAFRDGQGLLNCRLLADQSISQVEVR